MSLDTRFVLQDLVLVGRDLLARYKGGASEALLHQARSLLTAMQAAAGPFTGGAHCCETEYEVRCSTVWAFEDEVAEAERIGNAKALEHWAAQWAGGAVGGPVID